MIATMLVTIGGFAVGGGLVILVLLKTGPRR